MVDDYFDTMIFGGRGWDKNKVKMLSPLQLAYIGDAIYELLIRTYLLSKKNISVNELHKEAVKYVKAKAQADIVHNLQDKLTEEEWSIIKRGRNAKSGSAPKNAELIDYKYATGFETLMGFLYLIGDNERIYEIFNMIINMYAENEG
ncbi:ribonuclease-3 family protein [Caloranaerobacter azorensis DSM 13643]|uniref:Mini-ribonuclease 3 n=1 Tax=Caloranaerobacter azorensis DSM 13643 TaxID=1121264 RepID=A0A1M5WCA5_9FIRM|nr:ribonuclease III domain-containing protein [Caloranaerobacter azorensis]SHH85111.1 ribonuclease-3 family protein [Caloranaerobacter azorensis DSM 13643]